MAAAALGPVLAFSLQGAAWAQTETISNGSSANLQTATAVNGGPGDIDVASGGSVTPSSGVAVNLNSNNNITVEGTVSTNNANNSVGIQAQNGVTGSIAVTGSVSLGESFTAAVNSNGYSQGPFAQGQNRIAIQTLGTFTGPVGSNGAITVQGNNSYGIFIANGLSGANGNLAVSGTISLTGDTGAAIYSKAGGNPIAGSVIMSAQVTVQGTGSNGVQILSNVTGPMTVDGSITATGYATTIRPTTSSLLTQVEQTPSQILQGGSALIVGGSIGGGLFLAAPPAGTTTGTVVDLDGDGIVDSGEGTSTLISYGSAPALVIGTNTTPITLSQFGSCNGLTYGPGYNCFGAILEGAIDAEGIFDGKSATAVEIGAGGAGVTLSGGLRIANTATISATAYSAPAIDVLVDANATIPLFQNEGTLTSTVTSNGTDRAYGVVINPGAVVSTFNNYGTISSLLTGTVGSAYGVLDQSGTITTVNNYGVISTTLTPPTAGQATTGSTVALDLSANTTGVNFTQNFSADAGAIPTIIGDVLLSSSGVNTVNINNGSITGTLSLGAGATGSTAANAVLNISGATYTGALLYNYTGAAGPNAGIAISVTNGGTLNNKSPSTYKVSNLNIDGSSTAIFTLDPRNLSGTGSLNTRYSATTATIGSGATIGINFLSVPATATNFTVISAGTLVGAPTLAASAPFLFNVSAQTVSGVNGAVQVTVAPKTAAQLGLNKAETQALPAVYASLGQDSGIVNALANAPDSGTFHQSYSQMLPDSSGDVFQVVTAMSKAVARVSAGAAGFDNSAGLGANKVSTDDADDEEDDINPEGGLWASEYIIGINQTRQDNEAYRAVGLGLVGGIDFGGWGGDVSFASANVVKPHDPGDSIVSINRLELGLYANPQFGFLHTEARVAGGYLHISERREFAAVVVAGDESTTSTVSRTANGAWDGYDISGRLGASAPFDITKHFFLKPQVHVDFFDVSEGAYAENGGGSGFDLSVNSRSSTETSATASMVAGLHFGSTFVFKPQVELGWDDVFTGGPGNTTAKFQYTGAQPFTLSPNSVAGGGAVARVQLLGDGEFVHFALEAGGEFRQDYQAADLRAVFRVSY